MKILDCRGLTCPKPVIMTKKELDAMESGELEVVVDNPTARENVSKFAQNEGCSYTVTEKDGYYHININKQVNAVCESIEHSSKKNLVILVGTDKLGVGDDKLGAVLMKSYMYALSESEDIPGTLLFVNGGVLLTTEGSEVIESLKALEEKGVEVMSCGTCLDFYGLKEKLLIGTVTNMYTIIEKMNNASNTIKL